MRVVSLAGYPRSARWIINNGPFKSNIETGPNVEVARNSLLQGQITLESDAHVPTDCEIKGNVTIRRGASLGERNRLIGDVEIGEFVALAPDVTIQEPNHAMGKPAIQARFYDRMLGSSLGTSTKGPITVGADAWVGTNSTILSGVTVGPGTIVAAGSVVTKDVEPYSIVAGTPAEHVKYRFDEEIREALLELRWWTWDEERIRREADFFDTPITDPQDVYDLMESEQRHPDKEKAERGAESLNTVRTV